MELQIKYDFELTVGDEVYEGEFCDLTKGDRDAIEEIIPKKSLKRLKTVDVLMNINQTDELKKEQASLLEEIDRYEPEDVFKMRLAYSVVSDRKDDIMKLGDDYGYQRVYDTILEDISQRREGN